VGNRYKNSLPPVRTGGNFIGSKHMSNVQEVVQSVGKTPLVHLEKIEKDKRLIANLFAKKEGDNPAGSIKDRVGAYMLADALKRGKVAVGGTVIEPTSGNTGIGLAYACKKLDINLILTMPDNMSKERIDLLKGYGASVVLTPAKDGMKGAIAKANELAKERSSAYICGQFDNLQGVRAHYETTAPEIWNDLNGKVDVVVAGIGTGGTITGVAKYLKERNPEIKVVGVEPFESPFLTKGRAGAHGIQGIGAGFKPSILDLSLVDEIITVKTDEAYAYAKYLAKQEGVFAGISSGASLCAGVQIAGRKENEGKNVVVILPDSGDRYLSCGLFD